MQNYEILSFCPVDLTQETKFMIGFGNGEIRYYKEWSNMFGAK